MRHITSSRFGSAIRSICCLSALVMFPALNMRADVTSLSGTYTSTFDVVLGVFASSLHIQGPNFFLFGSFPCDAVPGISLNYPSSRIAIVNPTALVVESAPLEATCPSNGVSSMQLVYNGQTYTNVKLSLTFTGLEATTLASFPGFPTIIAPPLFNASLSGVAFTMTGLVTAYPNGSLETGPTGSALLSLPISGSGTFQAAEVAELDAGYEGSSTYQFQPSPGAFSVDTTTQGAWSGTYGGDGYLIANGPSYLPGYAAVSVTQASSYTWASTTSDPRALQNGAQATSGIASAYVGNANINIDFTDSNLHRVSLYLLDFDTNTRSETITVADANTGAVLDQQIISNFHNGVYANFDLQGDVVIHVTSNSGASAVVSGIFFGPSNSEAIPMPFVSSSAVLYAEDNITQGAWPTKYGAAGYSIANGPSSIPVDATFSVNRASAYTWAASTSDPRALWSAPNATNGIASAYTQYGGTPFSINIYTSATQQQQISLYLLDWDNAGRTETITISDFSTGTVLNTQAVSNFQGGVYLTYFILGNVVVTVQPNGRSSPVISGIFFN